MKRYFHAFFGALCTLFVWLGSDCAFAQISIDEVKAGEKAEFRDSVKVASADADYYSEARHKAERAAIRKERNFLEVTASLMGSMTAYNDSWINSQGGANAIAAIADFYVHHTFTKDLFTVESKATGKLGFDRMSATLEDGTERGLWFKGTDGFKISSAPAYKFADRWNFGANVSFESQFANGYKSRTEQTSIHRKSRFMSPGYFNLSFGFTYTHPDKKWPFKVYLSPIGTKATFVRSEQVRANGHLYGLVDPEANSMWEGGSSLEVNFDRTWGKNGWLRYRTTFISFYGWITSIGQNNYPKFDEYKEALAAWEAQENKLIKDKPVLPIHPTVRWDNTIEIKATKYISTKIDFTLFYDRAQNYNVQLKSFLSVGLAYTFKNK